MGRKVERRFGLRTIPSLHFNGQFVIVDDYGMAVVVRNGVTVVYEVNTDRGRQNEGSRRFRVRKFIIPHQQFYRRVYEAATVVESIVYNTVQILRMTSTQVPDHVYVQLCDGQLEPSSSDFHLKLTLALSAVQCLLSHPFASPASYR